MISFFKKSKKSPEQDARDEILISRQQRIDELKLEVASLKEELAAYRKREQSIADAVCFARQTAKEYSDEAKLRYSLELARLETYRQKWQGYIGGLEKAADLGNQIINTEKLLRQTAKEIEKAVDEDLPVKSQAELDFQAETDRISKTDVQIDAEKMQDDELKKLIVQLLDKVE